MPLERHHTMACYEFGGKQVFKATEELISLAPYQFMVAYHQYTKYLPLTMFFHAVLKKKAVVEATVKDNLEKRFSVEQVETSLVGGEFKRMANLESMSKDTRRGVGLCGRLSRMRSRICGFFGQSNLRTRVCNRRQQH